MLLQLYNQGMKAKLITGIVAAVIVILAIGGIVGYLMGQNNKNREVDKAKETAKLEAVDTANKEKAAADKEKVAPAKVVTETTCNADELSLSSKVSDAAAGTLAYDIVLTNTSKRTCILGGFPGVSLVNDNGNRIGSPADRATNYEEKKLTLAPGQKVKAIASLSAPSNFPAGACKDGATKLRVYPPNDTGYLSVATDIKSWCPGFVISPVLSM
jgi:hypothetical protein